MEAATKEHSILASCTSGGCGAKIGPGELRDILGKLPRDRGNDNLLIGFDASDDAAVYRIDEVHSLISTVDFFSPMVEDPRTFGRIAAANALSDVWAMGGTPLLALNLVCFPEAMDTFILGEILAGGAEKIMESGAVLGGGHSIYEKEPKYGLAVTGTVETKKLLRNNTPELGHKLILTKPLGVGIVLAAARGGVASSIAMEKAISQMEHLNRYAAEKLASYHVSACTDITGFGLLVHMLEMADEHVTLTLHSDALPLIAEAIDYADEYLLTAAGQRNRNFVHNRVDVSSLPFAIQELLFDPQTSGGLLIAAPSEEAESLLMDIHKEDPLAAIIGEVGPKKNQSIIFS
ncbi:MAG: selenide, water dikinase SelD [Clostridiales Family XIII bacterium]|nr:selenide, water dikinase SelD [Clostridiales Family XIII bacterium]